MVIFQFAMLNYRIDIGFELVLRCCIDKGCGPQQKTLKSPSLQYS